jgi:hypothetical protein
MNRTQVANGHGSGNCNAVDRLFLFLLVSLSLPFVAESATRNWLQENAGSTATKGHKATDLLLETFDLGLVNQFDPNGSLDDRLDHLGREEPHYTEKPPPKKPPDPDQHATRRGPGPSDPRKASQLRNGR